MQFPPNEARNEAQEHVERGSPWAALGYGHGRCGASTEVVKRRTRYCNAPSSRQFPNVVAAPIWDAALPPFLAGGAGHTKLPRQAVDQFIQIDHALIVGTNRPVVKGLNGT